MKKFSNKNSVRVSCVVVLLIGAGLIVATGMQFRQADLDNRLIAAIRKHDTDAAMTALKQGADANARYVPENNSSTKQNKPFWEIILDKWRSRAPASNPNSKTALMLLIMGDYPLLFSDENVPLTRALIAKGANVNTRWGKSQETPLNLAAYFNYRETVSVLLDAGADIDAKNSDGITALMTASVYKNPKIVALLLKRRANVNLKDNNGTTALDFAAGSDDKIDIVTNLLKSGADVNAADKNGDTPLMYAMAETMPSPAIVELLLRNHAEVSLKNHDAKTALQQNRDELKMIVNRTPAELQDIRKRRKQIDALLVSAAKSDASTPRKSTQ